MPIDTSIYGNVRQFTLADPLDRAAKIVGIQAGQNQVAQQNRAMTLESDVADAYRAAGGDIGKTAEGVIDKGRVAAGLQLQSAAEAQKANQLKRAQTVLNWVGQNAMMLDNAYRTALSQSNGNDAAARAAVQPLYQRVRAQASTFGAQLPDQFDPMANQVSIGHAEKGLEYLKMQMPKFGQPVAATGPDGKPALVQADQLGNVHALPGYGPKPENRVVDLGGRSAVVDLNTVTPGTTYQKTMTPAEMSTAQHQGVMEGQGAEALRLKKLDADPFGAMGISPQGGPPGAVPTVPGVTGPKLLESLPKPLADQVKALAEGRMAFPAGFALKSPYWQKMISLVSQYDPSFDAVNYNSRSKTRNDFTSGKSAVTLNAMNTAIGHLESLSKAADALNNSDFPSYNTVANFLATHTGDPRVKQFNATREAVSNELTRVYRGMGGSEADIKAWKENLDSAGSPQQLHSVIKQMGDLLGSKISTMGEQYSQGMGTTETPIQLITPHARQVLNALEGKGVESNTVTLPDGRVKTFPTAQAASQFKRAAGIR